MPYRVKVTSPNFEEGQHIQLDMLGEFVVGDDENNIIQDEDAVRYCQSRLVRKPIYDDNDKMVDTEVTVPAFMDLVPYIYGVEIEPFEYTDEEVKAQQEADEAEAADMAEDAIRAQQAFGNGNVPNSIAEFNPDEELVAKTSDNEQAEIQPVESDSVDDSSTSGSSADDSNSSSSGSDSVPNGSDSNKSVTGDQAPDDGSRQTGTTGSSSDAGNSDTMAANTDTTPQSVAPSPRPDSSLSLDASDEGGN